MRDRVTRHSLAVPDRAFGRCHSGKEQDKIFAAKRHYHFVCLVRLSAAEATTATLLIACEKTVVLLYQTKVIGRFGLCFILAWRNHKF
ncbi:MAG: hypothetical protein ACXIT4_05925 [Erythrobacter sp.]